MDLKTAVRSIPDFPKPGILFRDVTTLFQDPEAFRQLIDELAKSLEGKQVDLVVGPEARGFVVGSALAYALNAGLVLARKPGKLPCESLRYEYALEYGTDSLGDTCGRHKARAKGSSGGRFAGHRRHLPCHRQARRGNGRRGGRRALCNRARIRVRRQR